MGASKRSSLQGGGRRVSDLPGRDFRRRLSGKLELQLSKQEQLILFRLRITGQDDHPIVRRGQARPSFPSACLILWQDELWRTVPTSTVEDQQGDGTDADAFADFGQMCRRVNRKYMNNDSTRKRRVPRVNKAHLFQAWPFLELCR
jgi:hypothetical protein